MVYRFLIIVTSDDTTKYFNVFGEVNGIFTSMLRTHTDFWEPEYTAEDVLGMELNSQMSKFKEWDIGKMSYQIIHV